MQTLTECFVDVNLAAAQAALSQFESLPQWQNAVALDTWRRVRRSVGLLRYAATMDGKYLRAWFRTLQGLQNFQIAVMAKEKTEILRKTQDQYDHTADKSLMAIRDGMVTLLLKALDRDLSIRQLHATPPKELSRLFYLLQSFLWTLQRWAEPHMNCQCESASGSTFRRLVSLSRYIAYRVVSRLDKTTGKYPARKDLEAVIATFGCRHGKRPWIRRSIKIRGIRRRRRKGTDDSMQKPVSKLGLERQQLEEAGPRL